MRNQQPHVYRVPDNVTLLPVNWWQCRRYCPTATFERSIGPLVEALRDPNAVVLINCVNGRHRSIACAAMVHLGGVQAPPYYRCYADFHSCCYF